MRDRGNVCLVGFMGSGKTTVGREAARRCGLRLVELDRLVEARALMTIPEIFKRLGEAYFRDIESDILREVAAGDGQLLVSGGGVLIRKKNRECLRKNYYMIWLRIGVGELMRRLRTIKDEGRRPLLAGIEKREDLARLVAERERYYRDCDEVLDVDAKAPSVVIDRVVERIERWSGSREGSRQADAGSY
jgi:shikimate kinase